MEINQFHSILEAATSKITKSYFKTKILKNSKEIDVYRERVYCYELYHQMRVEWPFADKHDLQAEVDKCGSSLFCGEILKNAKPDFLIHKAGNVDNNFIAMEVKSADASNRDIKSDLNKLSAMKSVANYRNAIYLIFGKTAQEKASKIHKLINEFLISESIEIWVHDYPNAAARRIVNN